jgi:hypothetical protein
VLSSFKFSILFEDSTRFDNVATRLLAPPKCLGQLCCNFLPMNLLEVALADSQKISPQKAL